MPYYPPPGSFGIAQTTEDKVTVDTTTSSATWVDLLSRSITTGDGWILVSVTANASASANNKTVQFRITVDGTAYCASGQTVYTVGASFALQCRVQVTAGAHTVKLQWETSGTAQIRPVTQADWEHANMQCREVSV